MCSVLACTLQSLSNQLHGLSTLPLCLLALQLLVSIVLTLLTIFYEIWIYLWNIFISWAINSVCFSPLDSPGKLLDWKFWWKHHWKEQWNILGTSTVQVSFNFKLNNSICWLIFNYFDFWEDFLVVYTFCFLHLYTSGRLHWKILSWGLAVSWKKGWKQPFYWCCALQNRE